MKSKTLEKSHLSSGQPPKNTEGKKMQRKWSSESGLMKAGGPNRTSQQLVETDHARSCEFMGRKVDSFYLFCIS